MRRQFGGGTVILLLLPILLGTVNFSSENAQAPTNVSGTIDSNITWNVSGSPYIVVGDVTVASGVTLIIEPGVEVRFDGLYRLLVEGHIIAVGTMSSKIEFTSNQIPQRKGDWETLQVATTGIAEIRFSIVSYNSDSMNIHSSNNDITNNDISDAYRGIVLESASHNNIVSNNISTIVNAAIHLKSSSNNNSVSSNTIVDSGYAIRVESSANNSISGNSISDGRGIWIRDSSSDSLTGNNIQNSVYGIYITGSTDITSSGNHAVDDLYGLSVQGTLKEHFDHTIDTSNTVNGKPVNYYFDLKDGTIENLDSGHVTLAWSDNVIVNNCTLIGVDPMYILYTTNSSVSNSTSSNNTQGLFIEYSSHNAFVNNSLNGNMFKGIEMMNSNHNNVSKNAVAFNEDGINVNQGSNHTIMENTVNNNERGVNLRSSSGNNVTRNQIHSNEDIGIIVQGGPSYNNAVQRNNISDHSYYGILLDDLVASNNIMGNNIRMSQEAGIDLQYSSNQNIASNNVSDSGVGMRLYRSSNNMVIDSNITRNSDGIRIESSNDNSVVSSELVENSIGIVSEADSSYITILGTNSTSNTDAGAKFSSTDNITIESSNISWNGGSGMLLQFASLTINNSEISGNGGYGMHSITSPINIDNTSIIQNTLWGIYSLDAEPTINNTVFAANGIGEVWQEWSLRVNVVDNDIEGLYGARVFVNDTFGAKCWDSFTDHTGSVAFYNATQYKTFNGGSKVMHTPHTVFVDYYGLSNQTPVILNSSTEITIIINISVVPESSGDWIVSSPVSRANEIIILKGNLTVTAIGDLKLDHVTLILNLSFNGQFKININGKLSVKNMSYLASHNASNHYDFWFNSGSSGEINNSRITDVGYDSGGSNAVRVESSAVTIENSSFDMNYWDIFVVASSPSIVNSTLSSGLILDTSQARIEGGSIGYLHCTGISNPSLESVGVSGGMRLENGASPTISKSWIGGESWIFTSPKIVDSAIGPGNLEVWWSAAPRFYNSSISPGGGRSFRIVGATAYLINTARSGSLLLGAPAYLWNQWYLHVNVTDVNGNPLAGAQVSVKDVFNNEIFNGASGPDGYVRWIIASRSLDYQEFIGVDQVRYYTPHRINVSLMGYMPASISLSINGNREVNIVLEVPDVTSPSPVVLGIGIVSFTSVQLTWNAPGDDGAIGTADAYDIRYSSSGPITESNWATAVQVDNEPVPKPSGSAESFDVTGLNPFTRYWFAMKVADEVPNLSSISNSPSAKTLDNVFPIANAGDDKDIHVGTLLIFDGSASWDNDILNYTWDYVDVLPVVRYGVKPRYTFDNAGNFEVTLTVRDTYGNSDSDTVWINVTHNLTLLRPRNLVVSTPDERGKLILSWDASQGSGITGYNIYRSADPNGPYSRINSVPHNGTAFTDSDLEDGMTYYYRVTAVVTNGNESPQSDRASGTTRDASEYQDSIIWPIFFILILLITIAIIAFLVRKKRMRKPEEEDTEVEQSPDEDNAGD
jgi:parallel beta-helix repeat protein